MTYKIYNNIDECRETFANSEKYYASNSLPTYSNFWKIPANFITPLKFFMDALQRSIEQI